MGDKLLETNPSTKVDKASSRQVLKPPSRYQVFLFNDDYTPMEFVVEVLKLFFAKSEGEAARIMWQVHTQGKAVCGVFTRDIAETKVAQVLSYAERYEHPLLCVMEPE